MIEESFIICDNKKKFVRVHSFVHENMNEWTYLHNHEEMSREKIDMFL